MEEQKSLPAYVWGNNLAKMIEKLEKVQSPSINGAGAIRVENGHLKAEIENPTDYYEAERKEYYGILEDFKLGWGYYLSQLETAIIEYKLCHILESFTFKFTRMPHYVALIPERVCEINLRISEKIKVIHPNAFTIQKEKFFNYLKEEVMDPHREEKAQTYVNSMMHALSVSMKKRMTEQLKKEAGFANNKEYSLHRDCSLVGVEVANRCKY